MTVSVMYGLGDHQSLLSAHNIVQTNLWSWMAQIVAILCLVISRIAVIAFLFSLQGRTSSIGRIVLYTVGAVQGIINVIEVALILKQCDPTEKLVDPVRQVIVSNGGDCDCFVDTGDTSSGYLLV